MKNISERVETEIIQLAKAHGIQKAHVPEAITGSGATLIWRFPAATFPDLRWIWTKRCGRCCCLTW